MQSCFMCLDYCIIKLYEHMIDTTEKQLQQIEIFINCYYFILAAMKQQCTECFTPILKQLRNSIHQSHVNEYLTILLYCLPPGWTSVNAQCPPQSQLPSNQGLLVQFQLLLLLQQFITQGQQELQGEGVCGFSFRQQDFTVSHLVFERNSTYENVLIFSILLLFY